MKGVPNIGTALEVRTFTGENMCVTLVREEMDAPATDRYILRVDSDPRGKQGHAPGDEIAVEENWFIERSKLWPREGGVRVAPPRAQILDLFEALKQSLDGAKP